MLDNSTETYYQEALNAGLDVVRHSNTNRVEIKFEGKLVGFFYNTTPFNDQSVDYTVWLRSSVIRLLKSNGLPTFNYVLTKEDFKNNAILDGLPYPIHVRPVLRLTHPQCIVTTESSMTLKKALSELDSENQVVIAQPFNANIMYYRALIFYDKLIALVQLKPPYIIGDGHSSIEQLIKRHNRYIGLPENKINCLPLTDLKPVELFLQSQGYSLSTIPQATQTIRLSYYYMPEYGAIPISHPCNMLSKAQRKMLSSAVHLLGANFAAVDFTFDEQESTQQLKIIDVLPDPYIGIFEQPYEGEKVSVASILIRKLKKNNGCV